MPLLKRIRKEEMKNENQDSEGNKRLENMETKDINYEQLFYKSANNDVFNFGAYGSLASRYMRMVRGEISIINAGLKLKRSRQMRYEG